MDAPQRWLVANWKMHGTRAGAATFAFTLDRALSTAPVNLVVVFCPPTLLIPEAKASLPVNTRVVLGAQDCAAVAEGAFTGDTSPRMLHDIGARYVILGHSERRRYHRETDEQVRVKAEAAITAGLTPIICIGETEEEYNEKRTASVLERQCDALKLLGKGAYLIAYEPVWAIGSNKTPKQSEIEAAHAHIKTALGSQVNVLYGGSVKPTNIREILGGKGVAGALIGGASLEAESMRAMIEEASKA